MILQACWALSNTCDKTRREEMFFIVKFTLIEVDKIFRSEPMPSLVEQNDFHLGEKPRSFQQQMYYSHSYLHVYRVYVTLLKIYSLTEPHSNISQNTTRFLDRKSVV